MARPVVVVASGGLAVVDAPGCMPATEVTTGGIAVTKVARYGAGMTFVPVEVTGGGGTPAWVPANARVHIDFLGGAPQGRAWSNGAVVAINTLLGSDPTITNASSWGKDSEYNPAGLNADGYSTLPGMLCAFIGAAKTRIIANATIKFVFKQPTAAKFGPEFYIAATNNNDGVACGISTTSNGLNVYSWNGPLSESIDSVISTAAGARNGVAITYAAGRFEAAANGNATLLVGVLSSADAPAGNPFAVTAFLAASGYDRVQSITLYDPLPTTAGLSALSVVS